MAPTVNFPSPGCIVEFMEDNAVQIAVVLEEAGGKLRLLLPSRRETKLASSRLLPWLGPLYSADLGKEEYARLLETHKKKREEQASAINTDEVWELAKDEIASASAQWFAELFESNPDADAIAAYGRALLANKIHFRFQHPEFTVYNEETVNKRQEEQKNKAEKEALVADGASFLRLLWEIASQKRPSPFKASDEKTGDLDEKILNRIYKILYNRMVNPETQEDDALWHLINKGLPAVPHLPLQLLIAWGKLPQHYNFWFDRADYDIDETWCEDFTEEIKELAEIGQLKRTQPIELKECDLPFISIDGPKTQDIDDAFYVESVDGGWHLTIALACPALAWPFGSSFDKKIIHRATSVYLPEKDIHMLPEALGTNSYSLLADNWRPALCLSLDIATDGSVTNFSPFLAKVKLAANLNYADVQSVIDGADAENPASAFKKIIMSAVDLSRVRENLRINQGAIIMRRPEPVIKLKQEGEDIIVDIILEKPSEDAQLLVAELMVLASSALADWAQERHIALIHRTQNVALPKEYAGKWSQPEDLAKIMHAMAPSILEITPHPHAALAVPRYAPITSPLRRYTDLVNEAQIIAYLSTGHSRWNEEELSDFLDILSPVLEAVSQIQKFRPRYWKLLYFRQHGDKVWWPAIVTEENENFVNISLPEKGLFVRDKRQLFDERVCPGLKVSVRLGKVNPLYNEIRVLETMQAE